MTTFPDLEERAASALTDAVGHRPLPDLATPRFRRGLSAALAASAIGLVVIVAAVLMSPAGSPDPTTSVTARAAATATTTPALPSSTTTATPAPPASSIGAWSIEDPAGWNRATHISGDLVIITYATVELGSSEPGCAGIPEGVVEAMGDGGTLLTIALQPSDESRERWTPFATMEPVGPGVDDDCLGALADRSFVGVWEESGIEIKALGIGHAYEFNVPTTSAPLPTAGMPGELTSALASLRFHDPDADPGFSCVVTRAGLFGFEAPDPYPETPPRPDEHWFGSDELWTVLRTDGTYGIRKSVWWSTNFPGGRTEEQPDISVTWQRLDQPGAPIVVSPGTNAFTAEDGDFMIAGIDPDEEGCWQVTATYKGATLSYVYARTG